MNDPGDATAQADSRPCPHVLYINHVSEMGGAEHSLLDMVRCLDRNRFRCTVVLPAPGRLSELIATTDTQVVHLPLRRLTKSLNPFYLSAAATSWRNVGDRIAEIVRGEHIDIIHANSTTAQLYALRAAMRLGVPCLWHCRDRVRLGPLGRWIATHSTRIIAISNCTADHLRTYGADTTIRVIPNGIDAGQFAPGDRREIVRAEFGFPQDACVIAMIGQFVPWKRHVDFLQAAARVAAKLPRARFLVIGGDLFHAQSKYENQLRQLAHRLHLDHSLRFTGYRMDLPRLLQGIDIVAHPACGEPFGRAVAEAMAAETPVIAVDDAGPSEIIRNEIDGLLVPPCSPDAIADAVLRLEGDWDLATSIAREGRRRIEGHFSLDTLAHRLSALYDEVLASASPAATP